MLQGSPQEAPSTTPKLPLEKKLDWNTRALAEGFMARTSHSQKFPIHSCGGIGAQTEG